MLIHDLDVSSFRSRNVTFNFTSGISPEVFSIKRMLSNMRGIFYDEDSFNKALTSGNLVVYEFYLLEITSLSSELAFGTTIVYGGQIGNEYFMTIGHFNQTLDTAEIHIGLRGTGVILLEDRVGHVEFQEINPGTVIYVPPNFAHRTINISKTEPLVSFYACRADAGRNYERIKMQGFRKLLVCENGKPTLIDNPKFLA